jgi:hypothetical protein
MSNLRSGISILAPLGALLFACGGPAPSPADPAPTAETIEREVAEGPSTGTVVVQVVGDAVNGNAGAVPPDSIETTPIAKVDVYDGTYEAGTLLGETSAAGSLTVKLPLGSHEIGVVQRTAGHALVFGSNGHSVNVTTASKTLVVHVAPTRVEIVTPYGVGYGNAIYVTGETGYLGNWNTAFKATYDTSAGTWTFHKNLPMGAQFKLIEAPWVSGKSISVTSAGVQWDQNGNGTLTPPATGDESVVTVNPTF